jgi:hypothetical protein
MNIHYKLREIMNQQLAQLCTTFYSFKDIIPSHEVRDDTGYRIKLNRHADYIYLEFTSFDEWYSVIFRKDIVNIKMHDSYQSDESHYLRIDNNLTIKGDQMDRNCRKESCNDQILHEIQITNECMTDGQIDYQLDAVVKVLRKIIPMPMLKAAVKCNNKTQDESSLSSTQDVRTAPETTGLQSRIQGNSLLSFFKSKIEGLVGFNTSADNLRNTR